MVETRKQVRPNMRWISLVCLTLQTTLIIILYSYSKKNKDGGTSYLSSTVVALAEILKLFFCFYVILKDSGKSFAAKQSSVRLIMSKLKDHTIDTCRLLLF